MPTRSLLPAALCLTCLLAQQQGSKNIARTTVGRKVALVIGTETAANRPEARQSLNWLSDIRPYPLGAPPLFRQIFSALPTGGIRAWLDRSSSCNSERSWSWPVVPIHEAAACHTHRPRSCSEGAE
jgi:hypothetical protein